MQKAIQVQVPKPCHENWDQMTETDKGRFCLSCKKEVIDFRIMTDQQILNHISKAAGGVCGRFNNEQLNRDMTERKEKHLAWYKYFIHVMIPALLLSNKSSAQEKITDDTIVCTQPKDTMRALTGKVLNVERESHQPKIIEGKVTDEQSQPIPGATIMIKGTRRGVASDNNGIFKMTINEEISKLTLIASSVGFEQKEILIDFKKTKENATNISIVMKQQSSMGLGGIVVVKRKEKRPILQPIKDSINNIFVKDNVKVYPNPVPSGSTFNIDFDMKEAGDYDIIVINISGQPLIQRKIFLDSKKHVEQIACDNKMNAGIYFVQVVNLSNKKVYSNKILVL